MKIWRKMKSNPNLYRKGKFDQMWPSITLTSRQQKKKFRPNDRFFARELKKSIPLNIKIKTLKSYFYSKEIKSLNSILLKKMNLVPPYPLLASSLASLLSVPFPPLFHQKWTRVGGIGKGGKTLVQRRSRNYILKVRSLFLHKTFRSFPNYANEMNLLFTNMEQKKSIFNDILALKSGFLAPGVLRVRKLQWSYALKLKAMNRVRFLLGLVPLRSLVSIFKKSQKLSNPNKTWKFLGSLESLLPNVCLKMGLSTNMLNSIQLIQHSKISINGEFNVKKDTSVFPGDLIYLAQAHFKKGPFFSLSGPSPFLTIGGGGKGADQIGKNFETSNLLDLHCLHSSYSLSLAKKNTQLVKNKMETQKLVCSLPKKGSLFFGDLFNKFSYNFRSLCIDFIKKLKIKDPMSTQKIEHFFGEPISNFVQKRGTVNCVTSEQVIMYSKQNKVLLTNLGFITFNVWEHYSTNICKIKNVLSKMEHFWEANHSKNEKIVLLASPKCSILERTSKVNKKDYNGFLFFYSFLGFLKSNSSFLGFKNPKKDEFIRLFGQELHSFFRIMWNLSTHRRSIIPLILFLIKQRRNRNRGFVYFSSEAKKREQKKNGSLFAFRSADSRPPKVEQRWEGNGKRSSQTNKGQINPKKMEHSFGNYWSLNRGTAIYKKGLINKRQRNLSMFKKK